MSEEMQTEVYAAPSNKCSMCVVLVILSLLLSLASLAVSAYTLMQGGGAADKKVVVSKQYDKGQSLEKAQETKKPIIVFFYTDWCGFCQKFAPTYGKLSKDKDIKKNFAIAYVNCEKPENSALMEEYGIQGFPTVYVVKDGNKTHIENNFLFVDDAVKIIKEKAMEAIK